LQRYFSDDLQPIYDRRIIVAERSVAGAVVLARKGRGPSRFPKILRASFAAGFAADAARLGHLNAIRTAKQRGATLKRQGGEP
jgi:hypothetical protein